MSRVAAASKRPGAPRRVATARSTFGEKVRRLREKTWWPWVKRAAALAFLLVVATLVTIEARKVQWDLVFATIRGLPGTTLLAALGLAAASHSLYSTFDLLGRRYTGHALPTRTVITVTFVSYAFNLNLGTLVGGAGARFRLYLQLGLGLDRIARVLTLSMLTNWIGYPVLAGIVLLAQPIPLPIEWLRDAGVHWVLGLALLSVPFAYVLACGWMRTRVLQFRGHRLRLPSLRMAVLQVALSSTNWALMAALIWTLLEGSVEYPAVLCALLVAAVAGVLSHIPAGIGVLEAVFVALLGDRVPKETLIATLLAYRALYYLLPLALAAVLYVAFEMRVRRGRAARAGADG
jgi:uncharacterized membrane protein YbhN (UPF0104 family)